MCNFDFYIVLRNLGRGYSFGNLLLQWGCAAPRSQLTWPLSCSWQHSFHRSHLPAGWPVGMAGLCSTPLCFPAEGAPKVEEGLPWEEKLWKYVTASKRKTVPYSLVQFRRAPGEVGSWEDALFLVAALPSSLDLSRGWRDTCSFFLLPQRKKMVF